MFVGLRSECVGKLCRPFGAFLVLTMVLLVAPALASAGNLQSRQSQLRSQQEQLQKQLRSAKVSDTQVQGAVNRLDGMAAATRSSAVSAQLHLAGAQSRVEQLNAQIATLTAELDEVRATENSAKTNLRQQALKSYMDGSPGSGVDTLFVSNTEQATVTAEYRSVAAGNLSEAIDRLRQTQAVLGARRADLHSLQNEAQTALASAAAQAQSAVAAATEARHAAAAQASAHTILTRRIAAFTSESTDLAAQQQQISALIAQSARSSGPAPTSSGSHHVGLAWPLRGVVTSEFGPRWGGIHPGIDISDPTGTPVQAAKAGQVIYAGPEGGYGNFVLIDHGGGIVTGYAHQSQIAVSQGQTVSQHEVIGFVGSTGASTGPHLHFEVRVNGSTQNPRDYLAGNP